MAAPTILNVQIVTSGVVLGKRKAKDTEVSMDLSKPIPHPAPEEVVEAMRQRILQLENELHAVKKQKTAKAAPQQTTLSAVAGSSKIPAPPVASGSNAKVDAKTLKTRSKSLFTAVVRAAKAEKYQNQIRTVKVEDHFSQADFELVFGSSGTLVQPTPTNQPKSAVWIKTYSGEDDFQALFGEAYKKDQLKGTAWTQGSIFAGKSQKLGPVQLEIQSIEVKWSKNTEKANVKVEICEENMSCYGWY